MLNLMVYKTFKYFVTSTWLIGSKDDLENAAYTGMLVVVVNYVFENQEKLNLCIGAVIKIL